MAQKIAFITGGNRGIGFQTALDLKGSGAKVVIGSRDLAEGEKAVEKLRAAGVDADVLRFDVRVAADHKAAHDYFDSKYGQLDILVNNAGLARDMLAMRMKDEDWQKVIDIDLTAGFRLARASLRGMVRRRWGRIIAITSIVGTTGNPGQANYAAAKAGMVGMSKALAAEVAQRGITVNCVAPGFIATAMTDALTDEQKSRIAAAIPMGRIGTPDEVAAGVLFLASEEARYVTGQTLHINGGMAMI